MLAGTPPANFPGNRPTNDVSSISNWNKDMIYYSRFLIDLCVPWLNESSPLYERSAKGFCLLISAWNKQSATVIESQRFCFLSNFMTKGHQSSHSETAASAWHQQNADWWSEIKNHDTHPTANSATTNCGVMDMDDEAAGQLRSTDLHCIVAAAPDGHDKGQTNYHALRNSYTSLMCSSYLENHPYESTAPSPIFMQQNIMFANNLNENTVGAKAMLLRSIA